MFKKRQRIGWLFVSPYIVGQLLFTLIPLVCAIYFAFVDYDMFTAPKWVGLDNFKYWLFESSDMWLALRNTFVYALIMVPVKIAIACGIAALMSAKVKGIGFFRSAFYVPVLTPTLAVTLIWTLLYNPSVGYLNQLFGHFGLGPFQYVFSTNWFEVLICIIVMGFWKSSGYTAIYLFTAMQSISEDIKEAALVDGATGIKRFFKITVPLITPTIFFLLVVDFSAAMQVFDTFFVMAKCTSSNINVLNTLMYSQAWGSLHIGKASAISWISFIIILSITLMQKSLEKRWVYYE